MTLRSRLDRLDDNWVSDFAAKGAYKITVPVALTVGPLIFIAGLIGGAVANPNFYVTAGMGAAWVCVGLFLDPRWYSRKFRRRRH